MATPFHWCHNDQDGNLVTQMVKLSWDCFMISSVLIQWLLITLGKHSLKKMSLLRAIPWNGKMLSTWESPHSCCHTICIVSKQLKCTSTFKICVTLIAQNATKINMLNLLGQFWRRHLLMTLLAKKIGKLNGHQLLHKPWVFQRLILLHCGHLLILTIQTPGSDTIGSMVPLMVFLVLQLRLSMAFILPNILQLNKIGLIFSLQCFLFLRVNQMNFCND